MPILFSAVARDGIVLSNFASCDGNFTEILEQVLSKIPPNNDKMTYSHGHHLFHYIVSDQYCYFCITDKMCQRSRAFLFLNEIQRRYITKDKSEFATVLADKMYRYSEDYNTITIRKGELDELNKIGVGCSESILGEKILFVSNTENLSYSTITYVGKVPEPIEVSFKESKRSSTSNTENLSYSTITYVGKGPEPIEVSFKESKRSSTVIVILVLALGIAICIFSPVSCLILIGVLLVSLYHTFVNT